MTDPAVQVRAGLRGSGPGLPRQWRMGRLEISGHQLRWVGRARLVPHVVELELSVLRLPTLRGTTVRETMRLDRSSQVLVGRYRGDPVELAVLPVHLPILRAALKGG